MSKTAFLFPGQGAQSVGMAAELCRDVPAAHALFERASAILDYDLLELCTAGPAEQLDATVHSQPALFVASLAALERLRRDAPETVAACQATAGLSLGEYTALVFAESLEFEAGLRVVQERGRAMQQASDANAGGMVSILGLERAEVEHACQEARQQDVLEIANLLCPKNTVVSGSIDACERLAEIATAAGAMRVIPLPVAGAFHTSLMQPAVERLTRVLADIQLQPPRIPVVLNVDARPHHDPQEIHDLLIRQVISPVLWEDSMRWLLTELQIEAFYELGPGRVLTGLLKRIDRKTPCQNVTA